MRHRYLVNLYVVDQGVEKLIRALYRVPTEQAAEMLWREENLRLGNKTVEGTIEMSAKAYVTIE